MKALPVLAKIAATTRRFDIKLGEGGMRVELPPGHKHEWTLKNKVEGASKDGPTWLVPAQNCADKTVKGIINDVILDDRKVPRTPWITSGASRSRATSTWRMARRGSSVSSPGRWSSPTARSSSRRTPT